MSNLGHHDQYLHLLCHRANIVRHLILGRQLVERPGQVLRSSRVGLGAKVHAHKETLGIRITELLEIEDIVAMGREDGGNGVDDAGLVGAREGEDVIVFGGHDGRVVMIDVRMRGMEGSSEG